MCALDTLRFVNRSISLIVEKIPLHSFDGALLSFGFSPETKLDFPPMNESASISSIPMSIVTRHIFIDNPEVNQRRSMISSFPTCLPLNIRTLADSTDSTDGKERTLFSVNAEIAHSRHGCLVESFMIAFLTFIGPWCLSIGTFRSIDSLPLPKCVSKHRFDIEMNVP